MACELISDTERLNFLSQKLPISIIHRSELSGVPQKANLHQISFIRLVWANILDSPPNWLLSLPKSEPVWWPRVKRFGHCLPTRAWSPFQFPSLALLLVKPSKTPLFLAQTPLSKLNLDTLSRLHRPSSFKGDCYPS